MPTGLKNILSRPKIIIPTIILVIGMILGLVILAVRSSKPAQAASRPLDVEVVRVEQKDVPVYSEWVGTTEGIVNADIKAEVTGYLLRQDYKEGSFVNKGQLLFELDPRPFQAAVDQANGQVAQFQGQLEQAISQVAQAEAQAAQANSQLLQSQAQFAQAQANQVKTQLDVNKYTPLAAQQAVTQQDLDNAVQANLVAKAQVEAARSGVETARAQLRAANAQIGTAKAAVNTASVAQIELELILADGSTFPQKGNFYFADRQVDQKTGAIRLAGIFPNPDNVLRPGQFGRVRAVTDTKNDAWLVPRGH